MLTREVFNAIILLIIIIFITIGYILYKRLNHAHDYFYTDRETYSFRNHLKRANNGFRRFLNRLRIIWPMHLLFLLALFLIFFLKKLQVINNLDQYFLSLINLMVVIYFIDFINSEQSRRDSANKRFLVDVEIYQVISQLSSVYDLLLDNKSYTHRNDTSYPSPPYQLSYQMTEDEIMKVINTEGFWSRETSFFIKVDYAQVTSPKEFLKDNISTALSEVQLFLIKYSNIILYDDFRLIHKLEFQLKGVDELLKYDISIIESNIPYFFFDLIQLNKECEIILDKWHN